MMKRRAWNGQRRVDLRPVALHIFRVVIENKKGSRSPFRIAQEQ